jgi:hypothetical protein
VPGGCGGCQARAKGQPRATSRVRHDGGGRRVGGRTDSHESKTAHRHACGCGLVWAWQVGAPGRRQRRAARAAAASAAGAAAGLQFVTFTVALSCASLCSWVALRVRLGPWGLHTSLSLYEGRWQPLERGHCSAPYTKARPARQLSLMPV